MHTHRSGCSWRPCATRATWSCSPPAVCRSGSSSRSWSGSWSAPHPPAWTVSLHRRLNLRKRQSGRICEVTRQKSTDWQKKTMLTVELCILSVCAKSSRRGWWIFFCTPLIPYYIYSRAFHDRWGGYHGLSFRQCNVFVMVFCRGCVTSAARVIHNSCIPLYEATFSSKGNVQLHFLFVFPCPSLCAWVSA